jgi:hypothetical protein
MRSPPAAPSAPCARRCSPHCPGWCLRHPPRRRAARRRCGCPRGREAGVAVRGLHFGAQHLAEREQARPQCTARSASSSRALASAPKAARMLSPAYCSTLPRWASTTAVPRASAVHHRADGFGVQVLERGGAHHVQEQDADLPEGLRGWPEGARQRCQRGQLGAQAGDGGVDDGIAEQARCASRAAIPASSCCCSGDIASKHTNGGDGARRDAVGARRAQDC